MNERFFHEVSFFKLVLKKSRYNEFVIKKNLLVKTLWVIHIENVYIIYFDNFIIGYAKHAMKL